MNGAVLTGASPVPFWLDRADLPEPAPPLEQATSCDLLVVGGGFSGLWTALLAKRATPELDVVLAEADRVGWAASGRNGGFCDASLTHGLGNGLERFPGELPRLERLGLANLEAIEATVGELATEHGVDVGWERTGGLDVATAPWQLAELAELARVAPRYGHDVELLDADAVRAQVDSPTFLGGLWTKNRVAMVDPARLAFGLRAACLAAGVRLFERSPAGPPSRDGGQVRVPVGRGVVRARRVALATNAFRSPLPAVRRRVVPVYDYALVTEPLPPDVLATIGWRGRQGVSDSGNLFHYFRLTGDNRLLWGGYDAVHQWGGNVRPERYSRPATFARLAEHLATTFPRLADVRFSHAWGGAIDTCTRFSPFWVTALDGRVAAVAGYTGLGVGASRFGGRVLLDLLGLASPDDEPGSLASLRLVRTLPLPFPPEPLRYAGIAATRWSLARADARAGRRNLWLRALDRAGLGFDS